MIKCTFIQRVPKYKANLGHFAGAKGAYLIRRFYCTLNKRIGNHTKSMESLHTKYFKIFKEEDEDFEMKLEDLFESSKRDQEKGTKQQFFQESAGISTSERLFALALRQIKLGIALCMKQSDVRCQVCHMMKKFCFCWKLEELRKSNESMLSSPFRTLCIGGLELRVHLYMHFKELSSSRNTNTGKLMVYAFPGDVVTVHVGAFPPDEERLLRELDGVDADHALILFPCKEAVDVKSFLQRERKNALDGVFHLILIDGTWNNTKMLNKRLHHMFPHIKRGVLHIQDETEQKRHHHQMRKHEGEKGKSSTIGAFTQFLCQIDSGDSQKSKTIIDNLEKAAKVHSDHYFLQTRKDQW